MRELIFLLEEESAKAFLESLLPRFLDPSIKTRLIAFEGKQDLEKQLTKKIQNYVNPTAYFIVVRDQDSHPNCTALKNTLLLKCNASGKLHNCLVRIACKELESFYLADLASLAKAMSITGLEKHQNKSLYRTTDSCMNPSKELSKLTNGKYQKVSHSREIGRVLDLNNTRSQSFSNLLSGIKKLEKALLQVACH